MAQVLLINTADLTGFTDIGVNYDETDLSNAVWKAQQKELKRIVGKNLLNGLKDGVENSTLTSDEVTLLDEYVAPYLIRAAYIYVLDSIYLTPRNNGLGQLIPGSAFAGATRVQYKEKREMALADLNDYQELLQEYLNEFDELFPELQEATALDSDKANLDTNEELGSPLILDRDSYKYKRNQALRGRRNKY